MIPEPVHFLFSENINIYLQGFGNSFLDFFFIAVTNAGSEQVYIFLASLIFWCYSKRIGITAMYVILFSAFAALFAKNLFGMPRPPEYLHKIQENGFGFPSGHAQVSSGFWGYMGSRIKKPWFIMVAALVILSISISRIYLGVHYAGDVAGGIIFGLAIAYISFEAEPVITSRLQRIGRRSKYLSALMIPAIMIALASLQSSFLMEQMEIGVVMASVSIGYLLEEERICFEDARNNKQRIKRAFAGVLMLAMIYLISALVFPGFIFFKYAALGVTSTLAAPWVFARMESS
ncbi:Undecaprenyl-diphosphatase [uncultured archaeon]|nr:Undecaprenyl-diphosphatase [uncultured archaeon]